MGEHAVEVLQPGCQNAPVGLDLVALEADDGGVTRVAHRLAVKTHSFVSARRFVATFHRDYSIPDTQYRLQSSVLVEVKK